MHKGFSNLLVAASITWIFTCNVALAQRHSRLYSVELNAVVQASPPVIRLSWPASSAASYELYRRTGVQGGWSVLQTLPGSASSYDDSNVSVGTLYEYRVIKRTAENYIGYGFIAAGIQLPPIEQRGKVLLVVQSVAASALAAEISRLESDLIGDGWVVQKVTVNSGDSVPSVREKIRGVYFADQNLLKSVFLIGRVPIPYSGNIHPDGHENHMGAWPADVYYGEMHGEWTDYSVNSTIAQRQANWNVPGDGKFDQSTPPSDVDLEVGRVDMRDLTAFQRNAPVRSEMDLLRQYLNKNHNFRNGRLPVARRAFIYDRFGSDKGETPIAGSGWRNFSAFFGPQNISEVGFGNYIPELRQNSYLWTYAAGGGQFFTLDGIGDVNVFATNDIKTVFTMHMGSYFGDWDNEHNWLRSVLGSASYTLSSIYAGAPHVFFQHMGLGYTLGFGTKLSQNNTEQQYDAINDGTREVHLALMGDPTLRMHPVVPASSFTSSHSSGNVFLSWNSSSDSDLQGYFVYRSTSPIGPFARVSGASPISGLSWNDNPGQGTFTYMLRAVKLERSGGGTYFNLSQGIFSTITSSNPNAAVPSVPGNFIATAQSQAEILLTWSDISSDESGFSIERALPSGTFTEVARVSSNTERHLDSALSPASTYRYRLRAFNTSGYSAFTPEVSAMTFPATPVPNQAEIRFEGVDDSTKGNWPVRFGRDGYMVCGGSTQAISYAQTTFESISLFTWVNPTTENRALKKRADTDERVASAWYSADSFHLNINVTDTNEHQLSLYFVDWDTTTRKQTVEIFDAVSNQLLDNRTIELFNNGRFLIWTFKGDLRIRIRKIAGNNAVLMGAFFGGPIDQNLRPIRLLNPFFNHSNQTLNCALTGVPGQNFVVDQSGDLLSWVPIHSNTFSGASFFLSVTQQTSDLKSFYRVRSFSQ